MLMAWWLLMLRCCCVRESRGGLGRVVQMDSRKRLRLGVKVDGLFGSLIKTVEGDPDSLLRLHGLGGGEGSALQCPMLLHGVPK
jgi:hypothetical protein